MLHKRRRRSGGNDMGEAGILLTLVAGIGAAVVFQNLLRLRDNDEFPADELLTNELKSAAALVWIPEGQLQFLLQEGSLPAHQWFFSSYGHALLR